MSTKADVEGKDSRPGTDMSVETEDVDGCSGPALDEFGDIISSLFSSPRLLLSCS